MISKYLYKEKTDDYNLCSDSIVLVDSNGNELHMEFWVHDVVLIAEGFKKFKFLKSQDEKIFNALSKIGKYLEQKNKLAGGWFVCDNKFTWHSINRDWNHEIEQNSGFDAILNGDSIEINFFPAEYMAKYNPNKFLISMGGPDGWDEPYQSISNLFVKIFYDFFEHVEYKKEKNNDKNI